MRLWTRAFQSTECTKALLGLSWGLSSLTRVSTSPDKPLTSADSLLCSLRWNLQSVFVKVLVLKDNVVLFFSEENIVSFVQGLNYWTSYPRFKWYSGDLEYNAEYGDPDQGPKLKLIGLLIKLFFYKCCLSFGLFRLFPFSMQFGSVWSYASNLYSDLYWVQIYCCSLQRSIFSSAVLAPSNGPRSFPSVKPCLYVHK